MKQKRSAEERTAAERKMSIKRPTAGGKSRFARFYFFIIDIYEEKRKIIGREDEIDKSCLVSEAISW